MLLQVLLRALAESSSHVAHEGSPLQGREAQALLAVLGTWETAVVSAGPGALSFPSRGRVCWKALEPAPPPLLWSPGYKRRG